MVFISLMGCFKRYRINILFPDIIVMIIAGKRIMFLSLFVSIWTGILAQQQVRRDISLNDNWTSIASGDNEMLNPTFYKTNIDDKEWKRIDIPHNWDAYEGYRRLLHGNRHGDSWYKKSFSIKQTKSGKRFFLYFEGVGSYATVYLNGKYIGEHAGGRTTFTIDVTATIKTDGSNNQIAVRAYHPSNIKDLPWVCGGCSDDRGFSEGSQPLGIFRPVHLIVTNDVRIEPFGIHAWADIKDGMVKLFVNATLKNYSARNRDIKITHLLVDARGNSVMDFNANGKLGINDSVTLPATLRITQNPNITLWSTENPYLYKIVSTITENGIVVDKTETDFGFRTVAWNSATHQFVLNDKPVFLNGIAEYEHLLGQSHAFSNVQIRSRMKWLEFAGFNAFRDGHQPHNLLYGQLCNKLGILWWTQFSAHVWYDSPDFRKNFLQLLKEWVLERRNDPAVILWGLQNESKLPDDFAKECTKLIRSLDPTASSQRLVTTCNGGTGTDWDVPQNWTGTYGGDPATYANDLKRQVLVGEYGAWRTIDLHTEGGFVQNGILSEDRMTLLMEQKLRLAESAKDSVAGHFFWLLTSHDNPGRVQGGEGLRELDRIGPVNYKGLLTPWEEPLDVFYMFRSNYAPKETQPMVYIASHTWPGRWMSPGKKDSIIVYSNCDEVELFNDIDNKSLGKRKRNGIGTHFQWDNSDINYNVLYAVGYVNGKPKARDTIVLHHLPRSPNYNKLFDNAAPITKSQPGYNYIYRINCGGPDYKDDEGNIWSADRAIPPFAKATGGEPDSRLPTPDSRLHSGSSSWTTAFSGLPSFFASQRRIFDPIKGTKDWELFQDFRYGKDKLLFQFPLPDGEYLVELYFIEPWLGTGGGMDATAMRLFDVAINDKTVLRNIDIWKEVGTRTALKKTIRIVITGSKLNISFPRSVSGQAVISAIAIASTKKNIEPAPSYSLIAGLPSSTWLDAGRVQDNSTGTQFHSLPSNLYGAEWLRLPYKVSDTTISFHVNEEADVFIGIDKSLLSLPDWLKQYELVNTEIETDEKGGKKFLVYRKRFVKGSIVNLPGTAYNVSKYHVIVRPVTNMQPAYDLKPITSYRTNVAVISEGVKKELVATREVAAVRSNELVTIQWPVQVGVADMYSVTMKYFYPLEKKLVGKIQLIGAGNSMMAEETVNFTFTRPGKWNQFTIHTQGMINAGNYMVRLEITDAEGLAISGIELQ
jgi:hypothetical protein